MSRFIDEGDRCQGTLLPERIEEYVSDENPVRVIDAFVAELDLARLGFDGVDPADTGTAGLPPGDDAQDLPLRLPEPDPVDAPGGARSASQP